MVAGRGLLLQLLSPWEAQPTAPPAAQSAPCPGPRWGEAPYVLQLGRGQSCSWPSGFLGSGGETRLIPAPSLSCKHLWHVCCSCSAQAHDNFSRCPLPPSPLLEVLESFPLPRASPYLAPPWLR